MNLAVSSTARRYCLLAPIHTQTSSLIYHTARSEVECLERAYSRNDGIKLSSISTPMLRPDRAYYTLLRQSIYMMCNALQIDTVRSLLLFSVDHY